MLFSWISTCTIIIIFPKTMCSYMVRIPPPITSTEVFHPNYATQATCKNTLHTADTWRLNLIDDINQATIPLTADLLLATSCFVPQRLYFNQLETRLQAHLTAHLYPVLLQSLQANQLLKHILQIAPIEVVFC